MDRKAFLSAIGLSSAAMVLTCIGCSKSGGSVQNPPVTNVDFVLDLSAQQNAALLQKGGYIASQGILIAHTLNDTYIAVQASCTHENYPLIYKGANQQFYCNNHAATFDENGHVTGGPPNRSLVTYKTSLSNSSLRVFS